MTIVVYLLIALGATLLGACTGGGGGILIKPILDLMGDYDAPTIGVLSAVTLLTHVGGVVHTAAAAAERHTYHRRRAAGTRFGGGRILRAVPLRSHMRIGGRRTGHRGAERRARRADRRHFRIHAVPRAYTRTAAETPYSIRSRGFSSACSARFSAWAAARSTWRR